MTARLGLIPARAGSRRLPRKNAIDFAGKPMLTWSVEAALRSDLFDQVLVSTDDDEIADKAQAAGADVLRRGLDLSDDAASLVQVVQHAIQSSTRPFNEFCLMLANCPLRTETDIAAGHRRLIETGAPAVLSVTSFAWTPPVRALQMRGGVLEPLFGDWVHKKSQEYPPAVCPTGAVYWTRPEIMAAADDLYVAGIEGFFMPWHRAVDIDTREDYELALCIRYALDRGFEFSN